MEKEADSGKQILVLSSDEQFSGFLLKLMLNPGGFTGVAVTDINQAANLIGEQKFLSAIVEVGYEVDILNQTDWNIKNKKAIEKLRALDEKISIILLSNFSIDEEKARQLGIAAILKKPFGREELMEIIGKL
ncbi:MAG: hypothetical protein WCV41_00230 [Patescibacteria group bacterium]